MTITFNTNVSALTAQRYLGMASDKTASSLSKLSSGSRVPTAKDDAAALAVGSKLKAEVSALSQAGNNAAQAVTLLQIADGALSTTGDILNRMKSLAVQASSGQLSDSERGLLNQEFTNLRDEVDRIANVTNFSGTTLLNGSDSVLTASQSQAGFLEGAGIKATFDANKLSDGDAVRVSYDAGTTTLTVANMTTGENQSINVGTVALTAGQTQDVKFDAIGVTLTLDNTFASATDIGQDLGAVTSGTAATGSAVATYVAGAGMNQAKLAAITGLNDATGKVSLTITSAAADAISVSAAAGLQFSTDGVNFSNTLAGVTANGSTASGFYVRAGNSGNALAYVNVTALDGAGSGTGAIELDLSGIASLDAGTTTAKSFSFKVGTGTSANDSISFTVDAATTNALGINGLTIGTQTAADGAIDDVTAAITTVSSLRATIGANQSRLDFAAASVAVAIENTSAAQSALMDVDVSSEMTEFTSQQVLLQTGVSMLAQANQLPSMLLKLIQ